MNDASRHCVDGLFPRLRAAFDRDQPGRRIVRRIPIMGLEEHDGPCELEFDALSVQMKLGHCAMQVEVGRLLTMKAATLLDKGDFARKEISMAKGHVADTLQLCADTAMQPCGARG